MLIELILKVKRDSPLHFVVDKCRVEYYENIDPPAHSFFLTAEWYFILKNIQVINSGRHSLTYHLKLEIKNRCKELEKFLDWINSSMFSKKKKVFLGTYLEKYKKPVNIYHVRNYN